MDQKYGRSLQLRIPREDWDWIALWSDKTGLTKVAIIQAVLKGGIEALKADPERLVFPIKLQIDTKQP